MKKEDTPVNKKTDKSKKTVENQNIHDFNPSQFTTEEEQEKIKWEKEKTKKEDKKSK